MLVRALASFPYAGHTVAVGQTLDLPDTEAAERIRAGTVVPAGLQTRTLP